MNYLLARRSRARRRMIISQQAAAARLRKSPAARARETRDYLRETLLSLRPVTWVVTGEHVAGHGGVTLAGRFGARVIKDWRRSGDEVMRTTRRGDSLSDLAETLDDRVLKYDPVAAILVIRGGVLRAGAELQALDAILTRLSDAGVAAVVMPPTPAGAGEKLTLSEDEERFHRRVCRVALSHAAVVVPTRECHRPSLLATALFRALGINRTRPKESLSVLRQPLTVPAG